MVFTTKHGQTETISQWGVRMDTVWQFTVGCAKTRRNPGGQMKKRVGSDRFVYSRMFHSRFI